MSTDSQSVETGDQGFIPGVQPFKTHDTPHFHVEWTEKGDDVVYHFWPPGDESRFMEGFHLHLEEGFRKTLPPGQKVVADYTNFNEASVHHAHGMGAVPLKDANKAVVVPRENYYVRVVDGLKNPLAEVFLESRVFKAIEAEIKEHTR